LLEAGIDFAEDDLSVAEANEILRRIERVHGPLAALEGTFSRGRVLHDGLTLAIVGRPNAGKSSLFNALVERDRAIVTPIAGTTRDTVSERISLEGIPLELVDTAGLRDGVDEQTGAELDEVERLGIARSRAALADAAIVLMVVDSAVPRHAEDERLLQMLEGRPTVVVANKCDLPGAKAGVGEGVRAISTSAVTGEGIGELRRAIVELATGGAAAEPGMLTSLRHHTDVLTALDGLAAARVAVEEGIPHEMVLLDLYRSLRALDELTGQTTADDVLNLIFSTFCIGK
jgi:tRNA modification GTPase